MLKNRDHAPVKLNPISVNEFRAGDMETIAFNVDSEHRVDGVTLFSQAVRGIGFRKTK